MTVLRNAVTAHTSPQNAMQTRCPITLWPCPRQGTVPTPPRQYNSKLGHLMRSVEYQCTKRHTMMLEFSPMVGQLLKKRSILKWILLWHEGKVPDPWNLLCAARQQQLVNPLALSCSKIEHRLVACMQKIYQLQQQAPTLRKQHLQCCLSLACDCSDHTASKEIQEMIIKEAKPWQQCRINTQIKSLSGRSVVSVTVNTPTGDVTYMTREEVEQHTAHHLRWQFSLGQHAPLNKDHLYDDFGDLGTTNATLHLFDGSTCSPKGAILPHYITCKRLHTLRQCLQIHLFTNKQSPHRSLSHSGPLQRNPHPHPKVADTLDTVKQ